MLVSALCATLSLERAVFGLDTHASQHADGTLLWALSIPLRPASPGGPVVG